jgi:hypothetical protein
VSAGWSHLSPSKPVALVLSKLRNVMSDSNGWNATCPAHEDQKNSLSITHGDDGKAILNCHAGCETKDIVAVIGLQMKDLFVGPSKKVAVTAPAQTGEPVAIYIYTDKRGRLAYQKLRFEPKDFRVRRPNGNGGWIYKGPEPDAPRYLYRLVEFLKRSATGRKAICLVEGEKDAHTLWEHKIPATTGIGGAGERWHAEYVEQLVDAGVERIVIFPDNDTPGRKHAEKVAAAYHAAGIVIRVVPLPVPEHGDVSDYLEAGHSVDELKELCAAAPEWTPSEAPEPPAEPEAAPRERFPDFTDITYKDLFYGPDEQEEPLDYHWEGFVVRGSVATILGAKKHAKSWFADLLMVSAAAKEPIFPGFPFGCQRVLLISGPRENSEHETKRRLRAIHRQFKITPDDGGEIRVRSYRRAAMRLERDDEVLFKALCDYVQAFQPDAIRLDSAGALWGGKNEGDNTEVREWMEKRLDILLQHAAPGCTLYMLAHTGHAIRDGKATYASRHQRGASAWGDSTDTLLMVEKGQAPEGAPDHHVVSTIGMEYTRLGPETTRQIQLTISGGPGTGHPLAVALAEAAPAEVSQTDTEKALKLAVEALQKAGTLTQSELKKIVQAAKLGRNVVREALWVLRGSSAWTAGQYKGTKRALVREDGTRNNSPVMVWIGHSGDMWGEPESEA